MSADHEQRDKERTPHVHVEERHKHFLADGRSEDPQQPAGDDQNVNRSHEKQIRGLLTAVVAALRRHFHGSERNVEETMRVTAEVAEPEDRVLIPCHAGMHHHGKAVRRKEDVAEQAERKGDAEADMPGHQHFAGGSIQITQVHDGAGDDQSKPQDGIHRVEHLVGKVEAKNAGIVVFRHDVFS